MERVRYYIKEMTRHQLAGTQTGQILDDASLGGGKMIRPRLLLMCGSFGPDFESRRERLSLLAAMVELTHTASLIHDDIIDEAPLRRGRASIQAKYGKDAAVYAGDFLISRVNYWQVKEQLYEASMLLSKTVEAMCIGEIHQAACRYKMDVTCEQYLNNIRGKTASLFSTACRLGAMEAGCDAETMEKLSEIGENIGIVFQFRDDLLDFTSTKFEAGKETHKDFLEGIYTIPVLMAMRDKEARKRLLPLMEENRDHGLDEAELKEMEQVVSRFGGVDGTKAEIHKYIRKTERLLDTLADCASKEKIRGILHALDNV